MTATSRSKTCTGRTSTTACAATPAANTIWGAGGSDVISGRGGNDLLIGGANNDSFLFDTALNAATNVDRVFDFSTIDERILLEVSVFTTAGALGTLAASAFFSGAAAATAAHRIGYDGATGIVRYDPDGNLAGASTQFATLNTGLAVNNAHFGIV